MNWLTAVGVVALYNLVLWALPADKWGPRLCSIIGIVLAFPVAALVLRTGTYGDWFRWTIWGSYLLRSSTRVKVEQLKGLDWDTILIGVALLIMLVFVYLNQSHGVTPQDLMFWRR